MSHSSSRSSFRVLIAGGGIAALEGAIALRHLAGERVQITLLTPQAEFVQRPLTVREPFSGPLAQRYSLRRVCDDFELDHHRAALVSVDPGARTVATDAGETLSYDALLLALGAQQQRRFQHALNLSDRSLEEQLHGLVQDVEDGISRRLVFVVHGEPCWPLPIYELALMTARRAYDMGVPALVTIVTPEPAPLSVFGPAASDAVAQELTERHVMALVGSEVTMTDTGSLWVQPADRELPADRVIAMPDLLGPAIPGIVGLSELGFLRVDSNCAVARTERIFAAGDVTDFPVKQGGIAAQQADAAAEAIAALAGIDIDPRPFRPTLQGVLLGGRNPLYLQARLLDGRGLDSEVSAEPLWDPPYKIASQYLAPYLETLDEASSTVG